MDYVLDPYMVAEVAPDRYNLGRVPGVWDLSTLYTNRGPYIWRKCWIRIIMTYVPDLYLLAPRNPHSYSYGHDHNYVGNSGSGSKRYKQHHCKLKCFNRYTKIKYLVFCFYTVRAPDPGRQTPTRRKTARIRKHIEGKSTKPY